MKKNNSFKLTFYLGLTVLTFIAIILTLVLINLYNTYSYKFKKNKVETVIEVIEPVHKVIYDTVYIEKPINKVVDIPKATTPVKPKTPPVVIVKKDTINLNTNSVDSIK
jgi:hypothetical protein